MTGVQTFQRLQNGEVNGFDIFFPVFQFPSIPFGIALDHSLVADFRVCHHLDDHKFRPFCPELCAKILQSFLIMDLFGKGGID